MSISKHFDVTVTEVIAPFAQFVEDVNTDWGNGIVFFHMRDEDTAWDFQVDLNWFNKNSGMPWEGVTQHGNLVAVKVDERLLPELVEGAFLGEELV